MTEKTEKNTDIIKWLLPLFVGWRTGLILVAEIGRNLIKIRPDFVSRLGIWANFDGLHYLNIAQRGYLDFRRPLFPLYPLLIRSFSQISRVRSLYWSGLLIANISTLIALFLFYKLVRLDFSKKVAATTVILVLFFPTAFLLGSVYAESLFLLLSMGCLYSARKGHWLMAALTAGLASATQAAGLFLFLALVVEWLTTKGQRSTKQFYGLSLLSILGGFLFYFWLLNKTVGDPLYFLHIQSWALGCGGKLVLLYQIFWRYLKMALTTRFDILYYVIWLELLTGLLFLVLTLASYYRLRASYFTLGLLSYFIPTLSGTLSGMLRYLLVAFPAFIILAIIVEKYPRFKIIYLSLSGLLLVVSTVLFACGYLLV